MSAFLGSWQAIRAKSIKASLLDMGYISEWELVHTHRYGVPQLRPRAVLVALQKEYAPYFSWPPEDIAPPPSVGQLLFCEGF